ncbi:hypothetical protein NBRC111893_1537 [Lentilactobacillus kosonis]|uniref:Uncharacterized protein n=1 Tax=Lentilactobacillus kosonis TaxID=2810561 RepID=A0A401FME6_9LACO|nr:hypothetical protein NBRC111893_1537 [Lentilactobacillus kosonis]
MKNHGSTVSIMGVTAGKDLSKEIEGTPHGKSILGKLKVVGKLVD